jgi:hypothetical protein
MYTLSEIFFFNPSAVSSVVKELFYIEAVMYMYTYLVHLVQPFNNTQSDFL